MCILGCMNEGATYIELDSDDMVDCTNAALRAIPWDAPIEEVETDVIIFD